jgi:hypothetical protein
MKPVLFTLAIQPNAAGGVLLRFAKLVRAGLLATALRIIPALREHLAPRNLAPRLHTAVARGEKCVKGAAIVRDALGELAKLAGSGQKKPLTP